MGQKYARDLCAAARRHLVAGEHLEANDTHREDVAGYLFGIAAECALKQLMLESGMHPLKDEKRGEDPFYAHFEELKTLLRDSAYGRNTSRLIEFAANSSFMQHWDTSMRYSNGRDVKLKWVRRWHQDAKDVMAKMDM